MSGSFRNASFRSTSSKSYGKINDEAETQERLVENKKRARRRCLVIVASSIILVVAAVCLAVGLTRMHSKDSSEPAATDSGFSQGSKAVQAACKTTMYPDLCVKDLSSYPGSMTANPRQLVSIGITIALQHVQDAFTLAKNISSQQGLSNMEKMVLQDCLETLDDANDQLSESISRLSNTDLISFLFLNETFEDLKDWLSASLTFETVCADGLDNLTGRVPQNLQDMLEDVMKVTTNALGLLTTLSKLGTNASAWKVPRLPHLRRLLSDENPSEEYTPFSAASSLDGFPEWVSATDRKLLQTPPAAITADITVAQDGNGNYKTIQDAVNNIPNLKRRYIIYIKAGTYKEIVTIKKTVSNVTFIGDGIGATVITGSRNVAIDGYTTFQSATFSIQSKGFIAKFITFRNTAGPAGHQAVALRSTADYTVFDTCSFEGYQDTLYPVSNRQFFRGCKIYGTVDFIFGNAAAIFQNCNILLRQPMNGQKNTITAQGRTVSDQTTGFSFQNCILAAAPDLLASPYKVPSFLGRPWKQYSRTVFLQSFMDSLIDPSGWLPWDNSNPFTDTLYYGEYANRGPGSNTAKRVAWKGVHPVMSVSEAMQFTVKTFISGTSWLTAANVAFDQSLS